MTRETAREAAAGARPDRPGDDDGEDEDARLYERVAPELIRFATALVGPVDAADVLSSAVVKALSTPGWPAVTNRPAYLYRAVFNEAQTWLRPRAAARFWRPDPGTASPTSGSCPSCARRSDRRWPLSAPSSGP